MRYRYWASVVASIILGLILFAAGLGKLLLQAGTFGIFFTPDKVILTPALAGAISIWLPPVELIVGLLLIVGVATKAIAIFSSVLIVAFITNNGWLLSQGLGHEPCDCFGILEMILSGGLSTEGALYMDIGMLTLAFVVVFCYPRKLFTTRFWFLEIGREEI